MSWRPGNIPFSLILFRENSVYTYLKNETKPKNNLACCLKTHVSFFFFYVYEVKVKVAQSCLTLCNPVDYTVHGILQARILEWAAFPSSGDLLNPGIEPRFPALQADSLPAEPQGKPRNTEVGRLSLLQRIFPTQESNQGLLYCRWILYQISARL